MDTLDSDLGVKEETKQMKFLQMYQKLLFFTIFKYKWSILLVFAATVVFAAACRFFQFKYSPYKFEGGVTLFYTPRASEEVKTLSINQVLGIFSRQQVFHQLIEDLHLTEKQRAVLKQSIEVKLLRDQHDMFVITGRGNTDEYVKKLVNTFVSLGVRNYEEYRTAELRNYLNARERRLAEVQQYQREQVEALHGLHKKFGIIHPKEEMETVKKIQGEQSAALTELNVKLADAKQRYSIAEKNYKVVPPSVITYRGVLREYVLDLRKAAREYEKAKLIFSERNPRFVEAKTAYEILCKDFENFKKVCNITHFEERMLIGLDGIVNRYQEAEVLLHQVTMNMKSLRAEIEYINAKEKKLQHMIPEHERIELLLASANKNISLLVEELTRVRSNIAHVSNDIVINEHVVNTKAFPAFSVKILALLFIAGVFVSGIYAVIVVLFDMINGKFSGIEEAIFNKDFFRTVGFIPHEDANFTDEQRSVIRNEMFYHFILGLKNTRTLFSCSLDGSFLSSILFDEQFSKAKRNTILVRLILEKDVEVICKDMQKIGDFYYSDNGNAGVNYNQKDIRHNIEYLQGYSSGDGRGYGYGYGFAFFPIRNFTGLEPDEISKLYDIVNELKQHYQLIRISREKTFDASCLMVKQLHDICDATLLYIGKNKTPRRVLRRVLKLHDEEHKVYAILTGVTNVDKIITGDYIR